MGVGSQYREYRQMASDGVLSERVSEVSNELYHKLFHTDLYPMAFTTIDGRFVGVNEAFLRCVGYEEEELLGQRCFDLKLWDSATVWEKLQRKLSRFGAARDFEISLTSKRGEHYLCLISAEMVDAGEERYILVIISRLRQQIGEVGSEAFSEDLTTLRERVRAELSKAIHSGGLKKNDCRRVLSAVEHLGMAVLDSNDKIIMANKTYCSFLGYQPEELIGTHLSEVTNPDDLLFEEAISAVMLRPHDALSYEKRYVKKNGEIAWGRLYICNLGGEGSDELYKLILREDITSTKKRDLPPRVQQRIYRTMIGAITESILQMVQRGDEEEPGSASMHRFGMMVGERLLPLAGQLTGAEKGICYCYTRQGGSISFYGRNQISNELVAMLRDKLNSALELHKGVLDIMIRSRRPIYISHNSYPHGWEQFAPEAGSCFLIPLCYGKRVFGFYCLTSPRVDGFSREQQLMAESLGDYLSLAMENVRLFSETARVYHRRSKAREEDFKAQKMNAVGLLAGGMAHELNNQLSIIYACVDLSIHHVPRNSVLHRNILKIQRAAYKSANITRQLLLFGNKQPQFKVVLDINRLLSELRSLLERIAGESCFLSYDLAPGLWLTYADAANIEQMVINLVLNARDAMPDGGRIMVATGNAILGQSRAKAWGVRPGRYISITVTDAGCGIRREVLQHIFEPFFTTKEQGSGTGLGLSVAYGIVQAHHGRISVRSKPGKGSTFEIYLPVAEE